MGSPVRKSRQPKRPKSRLEKMLSAERRKLSKLDDAMNTAATAFKAAQRSHTEQAAVVDALERAVKEEQKQ